MARVIVVDSEAEERATLRDRIECDGHWVLSLTDGSTLNNRALSHQPDLIVMGAHTAGAPAAAMAESLRALSGVPIIPILIRQRDELGAVADLESVFRVDPDGDLSGPVRQILERGRSDDDERRWLRFGHLELDRDTRSVRLGVASVADVPRKHFELLWLLARRAKEGRGICPRQLIVSRLWRTRVRDREVDVTVSRMKNRLPFLAAYIEAVPGKGYHLVLPSLAPRSAIAI